jgi:hypothetical protein
MDSLVQRGQVRMCPLKRTMPGGSRPTSCRMKCCHCCIYMYVKGSALRDVTWPAGSGASLGRASRALSRSVRLSVALIGAYRSPRVAAGGDAATSRESQRRADAPSAPSRPRHTMREATRSHSPQSFGK